MPARIFRLALILSLLLAVSSALVPGRSLLRALAEEPGLADSDFPYHAYLPLVYQQPCEMVSQTPLDNTVMPGGASFAARWLLRNTGSTAWLPESTNIRFISGDHMHTSADVLDLPYAVNPGEVLDVQLSMTAPNISGTYASNWEINQSDVSLCRFFILIQVP